MNKFEERLLEALKSVVGPAPAAPAPTKPVPKPAPTKPAPQPSKPARPSPFKPTKPAVVPKPKAKGSKIDIIAASVDEEYEQEAHPNTREFWKNLPKNKEHPFGQHPILTMHGDQLAKSAYKHTADRTQQLGGHQNEIEQYQIFMQIMQIEAQHKTELEELAKEIVARIWGIDKNMLSTELGAAGDMSSEQDLIPTEKPEEEITPELRAQINKRITLNTMTQGSAVHAMLTMHHLVDKAIKKIDPNLLDLYNKLAASSVHQYWLIALPITIMQLTGGIAGTTRVDFGQPEEPEVRAYGICFPILCQELSKGVMELLTMHGLSSLDEPTLKTIYKHADKMEDEPYLIQVGPELWRRFLKVLPKGTPMANIIANLSVLPPEQVNEIINSVVEHPEQAKELIAQLANPETS